MDVRPKSNKIKRQELKRKAELKAERVKLRDARAAGLEHDLRTRTALEAWRAVCRDPETLIRLAAAGHAVLAPRSSALHVIVKFLQSLTQNALRQFAQRPDVDALQRLILVCHKQSGLFTAPDVSRYLRALLALSAHTTRWLRRPEDWVARSRNTSEQFHSLVRHLIAKYDVPTFMNTAWFEGPTPLGVVHQGWFIHVAQGGNIRSADGVPALLTKMQAHLYLQAPDDFDVLRAFRWAQLRDMDADERLVRSICATWLATNFSHDDFWRTVFRWFIDHPMLDAVHHGPIIDYLNNERFVGVLPNPRAGERNQPMFVPRQPNLTMKGRNPDSLLRTIAEWHRGLGRYQTRELFAWEPTGIEPLVLEDGPHEQRRVFTTSELLDTRALNEEGTAMQHCVASYASSCASGRASIWSLQMTDSSGKTSRLLTLEVFNNTRTIVQARQRLNKLPTENELAILKRWASAGGPALSKWLASR